MALYDAPVHTGYKILTHTQRPLFLQNGFKQVGNTTLPKNPISPRRVAPSAIYNKKIAGISEAGYGQRFPFNGLSYGGAGSPRASILNLGYAGAGSPSTSVLRGLGYPGAGSPKTSVYRPGSTQSRLGYSGAGSPRTSVLRDAYINDNPPAGSLSVIPNFKQGKLAGLSDDTPAAVDTGVMEGPTVPTLDVNTNNTGFFGSIENAFSSIFGTAVSSATSAGQIAAANAVTQAIAPTPTPVQKALATVKAALPKTILGMSADTALLLGGGIAAYLYLKK